MHDGSAVEVLSGAVEMLSEAVAQGAHSLGGVSWSAVDEMQPGPILEKYRERQAAPHALCPLGRCRFLPLGRRVPSLRHIAHDRGGGLTRLQQRERRAGAQRHTPFLAIKRVLAKIGSAAAGRHAHSKPALRVVENKPVLLAAPSG